MKKKSITLFATLFVIICMLNGCAMNETPVSEIDNSTETSIETYSESSEEYESEISEDIGDEQEEIKEEPKTEITDFSYLYGLATPIIFFTNSEVVTADDGNDNEASYYTYDVKISDNGSGYLLEIGSIQYNLAIDTAVYRNFIEKAVGTDYEMNEDGDRICALTENTTLTYLGESFTLVSYTQDDMGRGFCELLGEDGQTYKIVNDMSSKIDSFTDLTYFDILSGEGKIITRNIKFDEKEVLLIPYGTKLNEVFNSYVTGSPDYNSGNPSGIYNIQFDNDGNVLKIVG